MGNLYIKTDHGCKVAGKEIQAAMACMGLELFVMVHSSYGRIVLPPGGDKWVEALGRKKSFGSCLQVSQIPEACWMRMRVPQPAHIYCNVVRNVTGRIQNWRFAAASLQTLTACDAAWHACQTHRRPALAAICMYYDVPSNRCLLCTVHMYAVSAQTFFKLVRPWALLCKSHRYD